MQQLYIREKEQQLKLEQKDILGDKRKKNNDVSESHSKQEEGSVKVAIVIPMTSKGTEMREVTDSPLWSNLFDSFMKTIDWRSNKFIFRFT